MDIMKLKPCIFQGLTVFIGDLESAVECWCLGMTDEGGYPKYVVLMCDPQHQFVGVVTADVDMWLAPEQREIPDIEENNVTNNVIKLRH